MQRTYKIVLFIIISLILLFATNILATVWTVDDDGNAQFVIIQDAVDAAGDGDTVFVYSGIYSENICIDKSISLVGENRDSTIINGSIVNYPETQTFIKNFTIDGQDGLFAIEFYGRGTIENNVIKNSLWGLTIPFGPPFSTSILIYNNLIRENNSGIFFDVGYPGYADSIKVLGNTITENDYGIIYFPEQVPSGPPFDTTWHVNADSNYWGYNDPDSIAESIWDKNDSELAIAQLHYDFWYNELINYFPNTDSIGIHYNNIYNNSLYNVYAFDDQGQGIDGPNTLHSNEFKLYQNYPNPFNSSTTIYFNFPFNIKNAVLQIFNVKGKMVQKIECQNQTSIVWGRKDQNKYKVAAGIYFYRIKTDNYVSKTKKMILIR